MDYKKFKKLKKRREEKDLHTLKKLAQYDKISVEEMEKLKKYGLIDTKEKTLEKLTKKVEKVMMNMVLTEYGLKLKEKEEN